VRQVQPFHITEEPVSEAFTRLMPGQKTILLSATYSMAAPLHYLQIKTVYFGPGGLKNMQSPLDLLFEFGMLLVRSLKRVQATGRRLISSVEPEPMPPFGKCDKVRELRNNRVELRLRSLPGSLTTNEEILQRRIVQ
jgi:hypothetical protein